MAGNTERRNDNMTPSLTAKSNAGNNNDVILWADPSTHRLLVDVTISGAVVTGGLTNNNAAPAANNLGVLPAIATAAAVSYTEGNQVLLSTDLSGALRVTGSLSVGGTTDNSAFTAGTSTGTPGMGFYHSTIDTVTDGRSAVFAITPKRAQHVALYNAAGTVIGDATTPMEVSLANTAANATAIKVNVASGGIASGAIASGAIAAGAIAAGAFATGATSIAENEDVASADGDRGIKVLFKRTDTPANSSGTDGDYEQPQMSAGRLWVAANIDKINAVTPLMGNGVTGTGSLRVTIASDNTAFSVNATLAAETTKVIGTVRNLGNVGAVFDGVNTAATAPANGILGLGIYNSTEPSPTTGQSVGIQLDSKGRQRMVIYDAAGNTRGANVNAANEMSVTIGSVTATNISTNVAQMNGVTVLMGNGATGTGSQRVTVANDNTGIANWGHGATGSAVPAGATYVGLRAATANPSAATGGNTVGAMADKLGRQVVVVGQVRDLKANQITTITASTSETTVVTAIASTFCDVYGVIVVNSSATASNVSFKDSTAGTTQFNIYVPAGETRGFMLPSSDGFKQGTVNNNWTATSSASVSSLIISVLYVKNI